MKEWMNEGMNKWVSGRTNKRTKNWADKRTNEQQSNWPAIYDWDDVAGEF